MASVKALTDLTLHDLWREVKDPATLQGDIAPEALRAVKNILHNRMHACAPLRLARMSSALYAIHTRREYPVSIRTETSKAHKVQILGDRR